jgi:hydrogenase maturation protein HypF
VDHRHHQELIFEIGKDYLLMIGKKIHITGIVQGVGFRPFVYNRAVRLGLTGWVCNTSAGVDIELYGEPGTISVFIDNLQADAPTLAQIDSIDFQDIPLIIHNSFEIIHSQDDLSAFQPISPDICICSDCLKELFDPGNLRFRYPFINCTNCGPRLTIIENIPYDRPNTTMKDFVMCVDCEREYSDPTDRRFHAQPIACPVCGPEVWLELSSRAENSQPKVIASGDDAILYVQKLLKKGKIIAIKGLGGFHLACDATNPRAVAELRRRKLRVDKPFALMMPDIETIENHCFLNEVEKALLESRERPIVILFQKDTSSIVSDVSPKQNTLGVMLPYTPLHYLLFASSDNSSSRIMSKKPPTMPPLVMTSGNLSEEPIAIDNDEARQRLSLMADALLLHNRTIRTRCDDSVMRTFDSASYPLRRSRGYAPFPIYLSSKSRQILATGSELKNTFCLVRDRYAFLSHHIGDMENVETYDSFVDSIENYESIFRIKPDAIAYDLHPNYLATRYAIHRAEEEGLPSFGIQHHHAHIASCMVENSLPSDRTVIGVAFDGTGYGEDGAIWGGEFLLADYYGYKRASHLKYIPLPGGDSAIKKPARTALAYLWVNHMDWQSELPAVSELCAEERSILKSQLIYKINTPLTSSMGRFFDAVASLAGVRQRVNYEAQAAIEFEAIGDPQENGEYELLLEDSANPGIAPHQINPAPLVEQLVNDIQNGIVVSIISARFHNSIARMVSNVCKKIRVDYGINDVVLSGGVWQNMTLLKRTHSLLTSGNFKVHIHHRVPTNDGGIALGQAIIAAHKITQ